LAAVAIEAAKAVARNGHNGAVGIELQDAVIGVIHDD
jgi:hypothetical protein